MTKPSEEVTMKDLREKLRNIEPSLAFKSLAHQKQKLSEKTISDILALFQQKLEEAKTESFDKGWDAAEKHYKKLETLGGRK